MYALSTLTCATVWLFFIAASCFVRRSHSVTQATLKLMETLLLPVFPVIFLSTGHKLESFGKREPKLEKESLYQLVCGQVYGPSSSLMTDVGGPAHHGRHHSWTGSPGWYNKASWASQRSKSVSSVPPPWPLARPWLLFTIDCKL